VLLLLLPLAGCGGGETDASGGESPTQPAAPGVASRTFERAESEAVRELREAIDLLDLERAEALLEELADTLPVEGDLLRARAQAMVGHDVEVGRLIEKVRARSPEDPRVWSTAAELHASAGRLETARDEIRRGVERCGMTPELLRAQAIVQLCQQGGAPRGLELLVRALEYDTDLPFTDRALGQAHLLIGKRALAEQRPRRALESARAAAQYDPGDLDIRVFLADTLAANADFGAAVEILEELNEEGHDRRGEPASMYKKVAMAELLQSRRDRAIEAFARAREEGLSDEELGSGAQILLDEAMKAMSEGITAYEAKDLTTARERFEYGLSLDPDLLVLQNHLAVVLFQQGKYLPAAVRWRAVLETSIEEELELPDPVHLNLSRALVAAGEKPAAKAVLEAYLAREPEGRWVAETRELLTRLP